MKRKSKKKLSPLERMFEHHHRMCSRFVFSDPDRMNKCSCGRDEAEKQYRRMLETITNMQQVLPMEGQTA